MKCVAWRGVEWMLTQSNHRRDTNSDCDACVRSSCPWTSQALSCALAMCLEVIRLSILASIWLMGYMLLKKLPCIRLQSNTALNSKQVKFLHEMGATVRNSSLFLEKMQLNERKEAEARKMMEGMQEQELQEFIDFYKMMVDAASTVLQQKRSFKRNF